MDFFKKIFVFFKTLFSSGLVEKYITGSKTIKLSNDVIRRNLILSDTKKYHFSQLGQVELVNKTETDIEQFLKGFVLPPLPCLEKEIWFPIGFKYLINDRLFEVVIVESIILNQKSEVIANMKNKSKLNRGKYSLIRMKINEELFSNSNMAIWKIKTRNVKTNDEHTYSFEVKLK